MLGLGIVQISIPSKYILAFENIFNDSPPSHLNYNLFSSIHLPEFNFTFRSNIPLSISSNPLVSFSGRMVNKARMFAHQYVIPENSPTTEFSFRKWEVLNLTFFDSALNYVVHIILHYPHLIFVLSIFIIANILSYTVGYKGITKNSDSSGYSSSTSNYSDGLANTGRNYSPDNGLVPENMELVYGGGAGDGDGDGDGSRQPPFIFHYLFYLNASLDELLFNIHGLTIIISSLTDIISQLVDNRVVRSEILLDFWEDTFSNFSPDYFLPPTPNIVTDWREGILSVLERLIDFTQNVEYLNPIFYPGAVFLEFVNMLMLLKIFLQNLLSLTCNHFDYLFFYSSFYM